MTLGEAACKWMEDKLKVPTGENQGTPFRLREFQKKFILEVVDNPNGTRLAILSIGRKGGKTTLIAALTLCFMVGPLRRNRTNLNIYSAAMVKSQAALIFDQIKGMVNLSPELQVLVRLTATQKIARHQSKSLSISYTALSSDVTSKFGLIPHVAIFDELGQERKDHNALYSAIRTGGISDRSFCQFVVSTQAASDDALLSKLIDENKDNPRAVVHLYGAPETLPEEETLLLETFKKYHIGYGWNIRDEEIIDEIRTAQQTQSNLIDYKNLFLNMRIDTKASAFDPLHIAKCAIDLKGIDIPQDIPVYLGLDPSQSNDLTAMCAVFDGPNGKPVVIPRIWVPENKLEERLSQEKMDYNVLAQNKWVELVKGRYIDFAKVAQYIAYMCENYNVKQVVYDSYYFAAIKSHLINSHNFKEEDFGSATDVGTLFRPFTYGYATATAPLVDLQNAIKHQQIEHNSNPVLVKHLINSVVVKSKQGHYILNKDIQSPSQRIDAAASLIMAYFAYISSYEKPDEYGSFEGFTSDDLFSGLH